jgi:UDP-N-acetylglucosamine/UDP-N-acetylgalactosamine diphosphorylase
MDKISQLTQAGVVIPNPNTVTLFEDVVLSRIANKGVTLFPGTTLCGENTFIAAGAQIGSEGPVTIENCYVGPGVELKGGYYSGSVFLKNASCGLGSHVRSGSILEEEASIAHTVALKQTILLPYVTLGSLINFCDCLMAGGTDRKNHSEVGSSYIHFNFTPNQDKATPSLIGDVPQGVMLKQRPIFLGGQGGMVGPCRIAYGTVLAAGTICRNDQLIVNQLVFGEKLHSGKVPYIPGIYHGLKRIFFNNFNYIGNLYALGRWYDHIRARFVGPDMPQPLFEGLKKTLFDAIGERVRQLELLSDKLSLTEAKEGLRFEFPKAWPMIAAAIKGQASYNGSLEHHDAFMRVLEQKLARCGASYIDIIKSLNFEEAAMGTQWLQSIVHHVVKDAANCCPSMMEK